MKKLNLNKKLHYLKISENDLFQDLITKMKTKMFSILSEKKRKTPKKIIYEETDSEYDDEIDRKRDIDKIEETIEKKE